MIDAERGREIALWVAIVAAGVLAAVRFAAYATTVQAVDLGVQASLAWWSTYALAVALVVAGLLGLDTGLNVHGSRGIEDWLALLAGLILLVVMPADPSLAAAASPLIAQPASGE
jgi:hypothetical protein